MLEMLGIRAVVPKPGLAAGGTVKGLCRSVGAEAGGFGSAGSKCHAGPWHRLSLIQAGSGSEDLNLALHMKEVDWVVKAHEVELMPLRIKASK